MANQYRITHDVLITHAFDLRVFIELNGYFETI